MGIMNREIIKELLKGYFWCPGYHERKAIKIFEVLLLLLQSPIGDNSCEFLLI